MLHLPVVPTRYDPDRERMVQSLLEQEDQFNLKRGQNVVMANGEELILVSPDGSMWALVVDNSGDLSTEAR